MLLSVPMAAKRWITAWAALAVLAGGGCAAKLGEPQGGSAALDPVDGGVAASPDAEPAPPPPDAGSTTLTLSQSTSETITPLNSIACVQQDQNGNPVRHLDNSYYRVFDLAAAGVDGDFSVSSVRFGLESANSPSGSQPAAVRLYSLTGAFAVANLEPVANINLTIANQSGTLIDQAIPGVVPVGSQLVVELFTPASTADNQLMFAGSNAAGETAPSYLRAPACGLNEPTPFASVGAGYPNVQLVMSVTGSY